MYCLLSEVDVVTTDQVDSSPLGLHFISMLLVHIAAKNAHTVEPCLMTILNVPTLLPFTSILKLPLNSGHPATLYNEQFLQSQLYANNT